MNLETPWQAGRLSPTRGPRRLLFGRTYEDAEIERAAFRGKQRVFCIASAGDTAAKLAGEHDVVACDINPAQLVYAERRAKGGPAEIGYAERMMNLMRRFIPLVGWREGILREFLALSDVAQQSSFWKNRLDTWRFRASFDALMSRPILHAIYARQFLSFLPAKFGAVLRKRLDRGFARHPNSLNPYARALLLGEGTETFSTCSEKIRFVQGDAASVLDSHMAGRFDAFSLSNILDGAEPAYRLRLSQAVRRAASSEAVVILRSFAEPGEGWTNNCADQDRSMLWGVVEVRSAKCFFAPSVSTNSVFTTDR